MSAYADSSCYNAFESPEGEGTSNGGDVVLVYEPQSHATPVREAAAAAAAAAAAERQAKKRRRQSQYRRRRQADGSGCLTEILWEDVQRARDLLRLSRRSRRQEHRLDGDAVGASSQGAGAVQPESLTATPTLRSLRRHSRSSSRDARDAAFGSCDEADSSLTTNVASMSVSIDAGGDVRGSGRRYTGGGGGGGGGRRLSELRRRLRDMMEPRLEKSERHVGKDAEQHSINNSISEEAPRIFLATQFPLPMREPASGEAATLAHCSEAVQDNQELRRLQDEAAVQEAVVAANQRLLRECPANRSARLMKRRRTLDFARSQEKLQELNSRIAAIRTRDAPPPPPSIETLPEFDFEQLLRHSLVSLALVETRDASAQLSPPQNFRQLKKSGSLTSAAEPQAQLVSHACSLDSGFQETAPEES